MASFEWRVPRDAGRVLQVEDEESVEREKGKREEKRDAKGIQGRKGERMKQRSSRWTVRMKNRDENGTAVY